ncbi:WD40/YVTN/BNR-like repeat-containing protein [Chloroflexota bacterium]
MKHLNKKVITLAVVVALLAAVLVSPLPASATNGIWMTISSDTSELFQDIWGSSSTDVFAVGEWGVIVHYDGNDWTPMASGEDYHDLYGVWGSSSTDVFAVGTGGTILHYDGSAWSEMTSGTSAGRYGVWGSSATDVFAVGDDGVIVHYDGSAWSKMTSGTLDDLWGVWGSSATDVFAVGDLGTILHYDGSAWSEMTSGTTEWLFGVWGSSATDVFAVGKYGTILHYDGSAWSEMTSGTSASLYGVWGSSSTNVFAVGAGGTIRHYNGSYWTPMTSGTSLYLWAVWGSWPSVFVLHDQRMILLYQDNTSPTAPVCAISPGLPYATDDLVCSITTPGVDPDGQTVYYSYQWYKDEVLQTSLITHTVASSDTATGEAWRCVLTPHDGITPGPSAEAEVTIGGMPSVHLTPGWNLLGLSAESPVPLADVMVSYGGETVSLVEAHTNNWVLKFFYCYDSVAGGYEMLTAPDGQLDPWCGYWVRSLVECDLIIPTTPAP